MELNELIEKYLGEDMFSDLRHVRFNKNAEKQGLHHVGYGNYANAQGKVTHKKIGGNLVKLKTKEDQDAIISKKSSDNSELDRLEDILDKLHIDEQKLINKLREIETKIKDVKNAISLEKNK